MAYQIRYVPHHDPAHAIPALRHSLQPETIEWITPSDWDEARAISSFEARHPNATVLDCARLTLPSFLRR